MGGFSAKNGRCGNPNAEMTQDEKKIRDAVGESWCKIDDALRKCHRFVPRVDPGHLFDPRYLPRSENKSKGPSAPCNHRLEETSLIPLKGRFRWVGLVRKLLKQDSLRT